MDEKDMVDGQISTNVTNIIGEFNLEDFLVGVNCGRSLLPVLEDGEVFPSTDLMDTSKEHMDMRKNDKEDINALHLGDHPEGANRKDKVGEISSHDKHTGMVKLPKPPAQT